MRGRDALARLRCALLGVVDGAGELMERVGLDLLLFRWVVCVDDPRRSPRALKELEPTSKARLAPTFLAAVLSQPWPLLLRRGPCPSARTRSPVLANRFNRRQAQRASKRYTT